MKYTLCLTSFISTTPDKPAAPGTPEVMGTDKSSVALKWSPPTTDGGAPVGYVIEYRRANSPSWHRANSTPIEESTFTVTGLKVISLFLGLTIVLELVNFRKQ